MFYNEAFLRLENRLPPKEQHIFEKNIIIKAQTLQKCNLITKKIVLL